MAFPDSSPVTLVDPTRRWIAAALICAPAVARAAPPPCHAPRVLFVCPAGTVKSAIAREVLRARAGQAALAVQVESRGLQLEDHVSASLAANLQRDGIDTASQPARVLTDADVARADIVVAFDEAVSAPILRNARAWDIPSWNGDYHAARAALVARVDALVAELKARDAACGGAR